MKSRISNIFFKKMIIYYPRKFPWFFVEARGEIFALWYAIDDWNEPQTAIVEYDRGIIEIDKIGFFGDSVKFIDKADCVAYVKYARQDLKQKGQKYGESGVEYIEPKTWNKLRKLEL